MTYMNTQDTITHMLNEAGFQVDFGTGCHDNYYHKNHDGCKIESRLTISKDDVELVRIIVPQKTQTRRASYETEEKMYKEGLMALLKHLSSINDTLKTSLTTIVDTMAITQEIILNDTD